MPFSLHKACSWLGNFFFLSRPKSHQNFVVAKSFLTLCNPMDCSPPGFSVLHYLPECAHIHVHLILCRPLLLLPSIFPSIRVFSNESVLRIRWPKYWSLSFSPSNEYLGLISFRMDWVKEIFVFRFFFFNWTICFSKSLLNLLQYCFCFMFWFIGSEVCFILAPQQGTEPTHPLHQEAKS